MPIANYTTSVAATSSVAAIIKMLAREGASSITQDLGPGGMIQGLSFEVTTEFGVVNYQLPVRVDGVRATLKRDGVQPRYQTLEHATRVSWRIAHDWLRAQLALIDAGMVSLPEIMLPYALVAPGTTVFDQFVANRSIER